MPELQKDIDKRILAFNRQLQQYQSNQKNSSKFQAVATSAMKYFLLGVSAIMGYVDPLINACHSCRSGRCLGRGCGGSCASICKKKKKKKQKKGEKKQKRGEKTHEL